MNASWTPNLPGGTPDERVLDEIGNFFPKYFFDLLCDPVIKSVGKPGQRS